MKMSLLEKKIIRIRSDGEWVPLKLEDGKIERMPSGEDDILQGVLVPDTDSPATIRYPIISGVALCVPDLGKYLSGHPTLLSLALQEENLLPIIRNILRSAIDKTKKLEGSPYETSRFPIYAWSHYQTQRGPSSSADLLATQANLFSPELWSFDLQTYLSQWLQSSAIQRAGLAIDLGCSVGRFTFELAKFHSFALGIDQSVRCVHFARQLLNSPQISLQLPMEGKIKQETVIDVSMIVRQNVDFIVGDAVNPPLTPSSATTVSALNLLDDVPHPKKLLDAIKNILIDHGLLIMCSPYEWVTQITAENEWLGGIPKRDNDSYSGYSAEAVRKHLIAKGFKILRDDEALLWLLRYGTRVYVPQLVHGLLAQLLEERD